MPTATASFALRLLELAAPDGNVVLSPASVQNALVALRRGVSGATREALDGVPDPELRAIEDEGVVLELAQAVWVDQRVQLLAELGIDASPLDFGAPDAPARVNGWAAEKTHGMVPRIVEAFSADEVFALTDAAYFDGSWSQPFDAAETQPRPFAGPGGTADVPTMHAYGQFEYYEDDAVQALRLPYGRQRELTFTAVIARDGLAPPRIDDWDALQTRKRPGSIAVPRFSAQSSLELSDPLKALGLEPAFTPSSDFDGLLSGGAKAISRVLHSARVDVDEQGTRAAAVTAVVMELSASYAPPFDLRLDRPFLWAVEDRRTGTLLFLGIVTDPGEESI
jgi:serpin B